MDGHRFDTLTKQLVNYGGSRRTLLRLGSVLALPGLYLFSSRRARAAEVADAQCPPPSGPCCTGYGRKSFAQSFTAKHTDELTRATVQATSANAANTDDYLIEIRKASRKGKPITTVPALASVQVNNIVNPPNAQTTTVTANFSLGAPLKKGKHYALVVTGVGGIIPVVQTNLDDSCRGSRFEDDDLDNTFVKDPGADIVFATFVTRP